MTEIRLIGIGALKKKLDTMRDQCIAATKSAIDVEAAQVFMESQNEVPVGSGELKQSGYLKEARKTGNEIVAQIGYTAKHATQVHDVPAYHPSGKWQYLRDPLKRAAGGFVSRVSNRIFAAIRNGWTK